MKYSGEGNVINDGRFNRDPVFLVGSDDQLLIFHSCLIYSEFQLFWTLSERMLGGNFVWMLLHTILKAIFRFIYLEALSKYLTSLKNGSWTSFSHFLLQTFQRWSLCRVQVHSGFWPSLRLKHMHVQFILRCLAHDKAQIYRIFSYGAHSILSDQVATLKFWNLAKFSLPI